MKDWNRRAGTRIKQGGWPVWSMLAVPWIVLLVIFEEYASWALWFVVAVPLWLMDFHIRNKAEEEGSPAQPMTRRGKWIFALLCSAGLAAGIYYL